MTQVAGAAWDVLAAVFLAVVAVCLAAGAALTVLGLFTGHTGRCVHCDGTGTHDVTDPCGRDCDGRRGGWPHDCPWCSGSGLDRGAWHR